MPAIEISYQIELRSIRSPLTNYPATLNFMHSEKEVTGSKIRESFILLAQQLLLFTHRIIMTAGNSKLKRLQICIIL